MTKSRKNEDTKDENTDPITQLTSTQALDDDAKRELEKDVENAKSSDPILITIRGNAQGKKHIIPMGEITIGRSRSAEVRVLDPSVSGKHAVIIREGKKVFIEDLKSNNGTFLNKERLTSRKQLSKEDMITVGTTILKFVPAGELEILYHGNLIKAAYIDRVTGVYNHNYIVEAMEAEFKRAKALESQFSMIMIDLDEFKEINDSKGHIAGDFALREFCELLTRDILRPNEIIGRYGGDEFLILLWNIGGAEAKKIAERIRSGVELHEFLYEGTRLSLTTSIGVAEISESHKTAQDLFHSADKALYVSKSGGRNKVTLYE